MSDASLNPGAATPTMAPGYCKDERAMNPDTIAIVTRNAAAAAQDIFRRIYPRSPSAAQEEMALKAMADAVTPIMRKFGVDARLAPHNTEAHYAAAVLAIATAGVRALAYAPSPEQMPHGPVSRKAVATAPVAPSAPESAKSTVTPILSHRKSA